MTGRRGFLLMEIVIGLFACSVLFLAAGRVMGRARTAQERAETKWGLLLSCRTVLELSCATTMPVDTILVYRDMRMHAWTTVDSIITGELIVRAHSSASPFAAQTLDLARVAWPGAINDAARQRGTS